MRPVECFAFGRSYIACYCTIKCSTLYAGPKSSTLTGIVEDKKLRLDMQTYWSKNMTVSPTSSCNVSRAEAE